MTGNFTSARRAKSRNVPNPNPHQYRPGKPSLRTCLVSQRNGFLGKEPAEPICAPRQRLAPQARASARSPDGASQSFAQRPSSLRPDSMESCAKPSGPRHPENRERVVAASPGLGRRPLTWTPAGPLPSPWAKIAINPAGGFTEASAGSEHPPAIGNDIVALWGTRHTMRLEDF
jgi:hypothetical protein